MRTHRSYWEQNPHFELDLIGRVWKNKLGSYQESLVYQKLISDFTTQLCKAGLAKVW